MMSGRFNRPWMQATTLPPFIPHERPESWQPLYWLPTWRGIKSGPGNQGTRAQAFYHQSGTPWQQPAMPRNLHHANTSTTGTLRGGAQSFVALEGGAVEFDRGANDDCSWPGKPRLGAQSDHDRVAVSGPPQLDRYE